MMADALVVIARQCLIQMEQNTPVRNGSIGGGHLRMLRIRLGLFAKNAIANFIDCQDFAKVIGLIGNPIKSLENDGFVNIEAHCFLIPLAQFSPTAW
jgi:hypothetical protein